MKKSIYSLVSALVLMAGVTSCDKAKETVEPKPDPKPATPTAYTPTVNNVDGLMTAVNMVMTVTQMGITVPVNSEMGYASFWNTPGTLLEGGTVKLNNIELEKQAGNAYTKIATAGTTPADLDFSTGVDWNVSGNSANGVPAITYSHGTTFPGYTGPAVPTSVTKSAGVTLSFTSSNTSNADSVYVVIAAGSVQVTKAFAPNAGSVTITPAELSSLPTVSDNTGLFQIVPTRVVVQTVGAKKYAFVKQQANMGYININ